MRSNFIKYILVSLLLLMISEAFSQRNYYNIPENSNITTLQKAQYDFSEIEQKVNNQLKIELLKEVIKLDSTKVYYYSQCDTYQDFLKNMPLIAQKDSSELSFLHVLTDTLFVYDCLNINSDDQNIVLMIKIEGEWQMKKIPGFIILNAIITSSKIIFSTYQWSCCGFPYDFYHEISYKNGEVIAFQRTAIDFKTEVPHSIVIDTTKKIKMSSSFLPVYSLKRGVLKPFYKVGRKVNVEWVKEQKINGKEMVFVRLHVRDQKHHPYYFSYLLGWVEKIFLQEL